MSNTSERASYPSDTQIDLLLDYLEINPDVAKGFLRTRCARLKARAFWQKMQLELNSISGAKKTWKQWMKYWSDKKNATKKKVELQETNSHKTCDESKVEVELTETEERIIAMLSDKAFGMRVSVLKKPIIYDSSDIPHNADDSELIEDTALPKAESEDAPHVQNNSELLDEVASDPIFINQDTTIIAEAESSERSVSPPRLQIPNPIQSPPHGHASATTGSKKRRIWVRATPPSSQSQFVEISERFMQLEERRIDVEAQNAALLRSLLERSANREHRLLEALTNVGNRMIEHQARQNVMMSEALKALGEGLTALSRTINR